MLWLGLGGLLILGTAAIAYLNPRSSLAERVDNLYRSGDLSGACELAEKAGLSPQDLLRLQANCARQLGDGQAFGAALQALEKIGAESEETSVIQQLSRVQQGVFQQTPNRLIRELERSGADAHDARSAIILGLLAQGNLPTAAQLLDQWQTEEFLPAQAAYLAALLFSFQGDRDAAESALIENIAQHPEHEVSYVTLAEMLTRAPKIRLQAARLVLQKITQNFPGNTQAHLRLARVLRQQGASQEARNALEKILQSDEDQVLLEKAELELDSGRYVESVEWLQRSGLMKISDYVQSVDVAFAMTMNGQGSGGEPLTRRINWAATALALGGEMALSEQIFAVALDRVARLRRFVDLRVKQQLQPAEQSIVDELNQLTSPAFAPNHPLIERLNPRNLDPTSDDMEPTTELTGKTLYSQLCADCHGMDGRGFGRSARHLFPGPRNFRREPNRYVSTANRVAADQDLEGTILKGLPGTSMPAFPNLDRTQLAELITQIRTFRKLGLEDEYQELSRTNLLTTDQSAWIRRRSQPAERIAVPKFSDATAQAIDMGRTIFLKAGCAQCHRTQPNPQAPHTHSATGVVFHDSLGRPMQARDLESDEFRGGNSAEAIYLRIALGMPGTPHPAIENLMEDEATALVAYIRDLAKKPRTPTTNSERRNLLLGRP